MHYKVGHNSRNGAALLVVLFVIMVITVLSLGFLSQSDVELACGRNMVLKMQMDYLSESALEHAKGIILNPQDLENPYYTGAAGLQLIGTSNDYYDISVVFDESNPNDQCNYIIDCNAYRLKNSEKIGRSNITAQLRLDPCIALWTGDDLCVSNLTTIYGDIYCNGTVNNDGTIEGDVFAQSISGDNAAGQRYDISQLGLDWPAIYTSSFIDESGVSYSAGDKTLSEDINGMLLVDGDLTIDSSSNISLNASKNLPALFVTGDMIINSDLDVEGLAVINNRLLINADADINVEGGLFIGSQILEITSEFSGNDAYAILHNNPTWSEGKYNNSLKFDGSDDYLEVENENLFDITNEITVSAWIKVNSFNKNYQAIVTKGDSAWRLQRYSNTNKIEFACSGLSINQYGNIWSNTGIAYNQWHHVAGVYDGSTISVYIDGVLDVSNTASGLINTNNYNVLIGKNAQESGRNWNGWIDDIQVYNRGLDPNEISLIKTGATVSNLVAHWKLDETGSNINITASPTNTAVLLYSEEGDTIKWGQAAGAFYRSIERN